jgi:hypothetical protein
MATKRSVSKKFYTSEEVMDILQHDSDSDTDLYDSDSSDLSEEEIDLLETVENVEETIVEDDNEEMSVEDNEEIEMPGFDWDFLHEMETYEPDWLPDYNQQRGVLVNTDDFSIGQYFCLFFPTEAFQLIADETNRYSVQFFDKTTELSAKSRFSRWTATNLEEIKAFVALNIAMGINAKPSEKEYWSKFWLTQVQFGKVMSRDRYQLLKTFLHFSDNDERPERNEPNYNPLFKIQPLLDICLPLYTQVYCPGRDLSIDESMVKFKGRIDFRQYMPAKPVKWGIKEFCLCDAKNGYCLKSMTYTGICCFII